MAKRKFGASIIILCIAAVTLISGTYAWFLVGGFAELFDIGFDVIEATGGLLLRGDKSSSQWGTELKREDFEDFDFIATGGRYKPISADPNATSFGSNFVEVSMDGNDMFVCSPVFVRNKKSEDIKENEICYNDFTFSIKSTEGEIVGSETADGDYASGAYMRIELSGNVYDDQGKVVEEKVLGGGASVAARISVTRDDKTVVYALNDDEGKAAAYNAVSKIFDDDTIYDAVVTDDKGNQIIDEKDTGYTAAGLVTVNAKAVMKKNAEGKWTTIKLPLGNIPANSTNGKEITVRIWLEGNDPECVDFPNGGIAGKNLITSITFGVD